MEALLGFIAPIFFLSMLMIAISLSPGYSPLTHTISELAYFPAKTLFSIAFITYGTLAIPFAIKLERENQNPPLPNLVVQKQAILYYYKAEE